MVLFLVLLPLTVKYHFVESMGNQTNIILKNDNTTRPLICRWGSCLIACCCVSVTISAAQPQFLAVVHPLNSKFANWWLTTRSEQSKRHTHNKRCFLMEQLCKLQPQKYKLHKGSNYLHIILQCACQEGKMFSCSPHFSKIFTIKCAAAGPRIKHMHGGTDCN